MSDELLDKYYSFNFDLFVSISEELLDEYYSFAFYEYYSFNFDLFVSMSEELLDEYYSFAFYKYYSFAHHLYRSMSEELLEKYITFKIQFINNPTIETSIPDHNGTSEPVKVQKSFMQIVQLVKSLPIPKRNYLHIHHYATEPIHSDATDQTIDEQSLMPNHTIDIVENSEKITFTSVNQICNHNNNLNNEDVEEDNSGPIIDD